jgi:predicted phosphodiesterase
MRLGIFSDVHGNLEALNAVIEAYKSENVDRYICLGDTVGYGASPQECCNLVRPLASVCVLGNHDAAVAGRMDYSYYYDAARHALDVHAAALDASNMEWLKGLSYEVREGPLAFCHGSPVCLEEFEYIFSLDQAAKCLPVFDELAEVTFIGHSHLCKAFAINPKYEGSQEVVTLKFQLRDGWKYIISVGSVGQPRDFDPRASYTVFDTESKTFEFKRVEYDTKTAASKILASDLEPNFGTRLFLGI